MRQLLSQAGIAALVSMFMGIAPLAMAVTYALWPTEHRLALMRPLSLATIFAAVAGLCLGLVNQLRHLFMQSTPSIDRVVLVGLAESLVPMLTGFGCLTAAWLLVAVGLWRRP